MYKIHLTENEKNWLEDLVDSAKISTQKLDIIKKLANPLMEYE